MKTLGNAAAVLPLDAERSALLDRLVEGLEPDTLNWLSGFVAGLAHGRTRPAEPAASPEAGDRATVLYGSQTGNGRRIAEKLKARLDAAGLPSRIVSAADYRPRELAGERVLLFVVSTQGDGEPPDDARALSQFLLGPRAPRLEQLGYAVFALGDSSYPRFCETGRVIDRRLAELGARSLLPRIDADVDLDAAAGTWLDDAVAVAGKELGPARLAVVTPLRPAPSTVATREQPADADILANQPLTAVEATRSVHHLELALPPGRFPYEPGDAIGVWPVNPALAVKRIVDSLGAVDGLPVQLDGRERMLGDWLAHEREITRLTRPFLAQHAARAGDPALSRLLAPGEAPALREAMRNWQLADILDAYPAQWEPGELVAALRPLAPRSYSIASSRAAVGDEAHIAVAVLDEALATGSRRQGAASTFLAGQPAGSATVRAFLEPNPRFRLPADPARDIVMIGAGTGIAPYRGFLQERIEHGAGGRHWLLFGGRRLRADFLYQAEWLDALRKGALHRLDVAFSRDQEARHYVQHRIVEQGEELHAWLESGAVVYVCGDAERMAPDVEAALLSVIGTHGGRSAESAREYLDELAASKRYLRDVY